MFRALRLGQRHLRAKLDTKKSIVENDVLLKRKPHPQKREADPPSPGYGAAGEGRMTKQ